eukprot:2878865-Rhodomonas_salina.2
MDHHDVRRLQSGEIAGSELRRVGAKTQTAASSCACQRASAPLGPATLAPGPGPAATEWPGPGLESHSLTLSCSGILSVLDRLSRASL